MTRKLLSGVLAFAMVFGCTAPVALAEDTTVEEVEQYTVYAPSLGASSVTLLNAGDKATVSITDVADGAKVETGDDNFTATVKDGILTITAVNKVAADTQLTLTFTSTSLDEVGEPVPDKYRGEVKLTVKKGAVVAPVITLDPAFKMPGSVAVGETIEATLFGTKGEEKGAPVVEAVLNDVAKKFFTVATKDYVNPTTKKVEGTTIVVTATKAMTADDMLDMTVSEVLPSIRVTATYGSCKEGPKTVPLCFVVAETKAPVSISLSANATSATVGKGVELAAKVGMDDGFGGVYYNDKADVVWYVNGTKVTGTKVTDALGNDIATLTKDDTGLSAATFKGLKAGTYKVTVETADGNYSGSKTITVTNPAMTAIDTLHIASATDWSVDDKTGGIKVTTPGTTVDLSGIRFAGREDVTGTTKPGHPIADFGIAVTGYAVENAVVDGKVIAGEAVAKKAVSVDAKGLVTVADESNAVMKELLTLAKGKDITFNIIVSFKNAAGKTYSLWDQTPVQVVVTKPSEKAASIELYLDGKKVDTTKSVVLSVGKTYDFDVLVKDAHGYSDAVDQRVVWQIDGNSDKTVYATVDQSGVVTPLQASIESASLKVASITGTTAPVTVKLIIVGEATKPTEKPTEAPTQAPETKTGTVNTSSSALNIRAAASTGATVVAKAAKGSTVTILGEENGFYKVKLADGTVGYASKAYIKVTTDTPVVTITATTTANLKLRTSAPSGSVITVMPKGATVKVIEGGQSWAKVEYNGKVGYASNNYLTFNTVG